MKPSRASASALGLLALAIAASMGPLACTGPGLEPPGEPKAAGPFAGQPMAAPDPNSDGDRGGNANGVPGPGAPSDDMSPAPTDTTDTAMESDEDAGVDDEGPGAP